MKILLTGESSFVGRHLKEILQKEGHEVYSLVRQSAKNDRQITWDFKGPLSEHMPSCEAVVHLAAFVYFDNSLQLEQYQVNTISTLYLTQYAKKQKAVFIFASMAGLHGGAREINKNTPIMPLNHYAMSKYLAEEVIKQTTDRAYILRIGGIYGLDGPAHLGLNGAITEAFHRNIPPVLKGDGQPRRNYIYVGDVARWIVSLVNHTRKNDFCEILYFASQETLTVKQYLMAIMDVFFKGQELIMMPGNPSSDCVVEASQAPFPTISFMIYLESLKNRRIPK